MDISQTGLMAMARPAWTLPASMLNHSDTVSSCPGMAASLLKLGHVGAAMMVEALSADARIVEQRMLMMCLLFGSFFF